MGCAQITCYFRWSMQCCSRHSSASARCISCSLFAPLLRTKCKSSSRSRFPARLPQERLAAARVIGHALRQRSWLGKWVAALERAEHDSKHLAARKGKGKGDKGKGNRSASRKGKGKGGSRRMEPGNIYAKCTDTSSSQST